MAMLYDLHGRRVNYLRVSLTTRCNYRCIYCKPDAQHCSTNSRHELKREELFAIIGAAAAQGMNKVRLTGGEPLLYPELIRLVGEIVQYSGVDDLALTTNGSLLASCAKDLAAAGLNRVNISLDSLHPERFRQITGGGRLQQVLQGIDIAQQAGLTPIKINTVVMRGVNTEDVTDFVRLARDEGLEVRFIEYMPFGTDPSSWESRFVPMKEIEAMCRQLVSLEETDSSGGPATTWQIRGSQGRLGFIAPFNQHFCSDCNRLRLTADGKLRPCLFSGQELDLRPLLHRQEHIRKAVADAVAMKKENRISNMQMGGDWHCERQMYQIGG